MPQVLENNNGRENRHVIFTSIVLFKDFLFLQQVYKWCLRLEIWNTNQFIESFSGFVDMQGYQDVSGMNWYLKLI